tara:strand:- start:733 stop:1341 length:609 start_codon:yes stop_codon:yes gene_type:complete
LKEKLTVSDSKKLFHEQFPYVIPSLYKRIVDEMIVELNLLNHQSKFTQDSYFCVGLTETFKELTNGYHPEKHLEPLFNALCNSTNFIPDDIKAISQNKINEHKNMSSKDSIDLIVKESSSSIFYSRIFILGVYKIISRAEDFKELDESNINKLINDLAEEFKIPLSRIDKDLSMYKSNINKIEQAKALLEETIKSEREKRKK